MSCIFSNIPYIKIKFNNGFAEALLDTGCYHNLISSRMKINKNLLFECHKKLDWSNSLLKVLGILKYTEISLLNRKFVVDLIVVKITV